MDKFYRFKVSSWNDKTAERFEFVRETSAYYIDARGQRTRKETMYYRFYNTEPEALAVLEKRRRSKSELAAKRRIESYGPELLEALEDARAAFLAGERPNLQQIDAIIQKAKGEPA